MNPTLTTGLLAALGAALLTACGGGGDTVSGQTPEQSAAAATATAQGLQSPLPPRPDFDPAAAAQINPNLGSYGAVQAPSVAMNDSGDALVVYRSTANFSVLPYHWFAHRLDAITGQVGPQRNIGLPDQTAGESASNLTLRAAPSGDNALAIWTEDRDVYTPAYAIDAVVAEHRAGQWAPALRVSQQDPAYVAGSRVQSVDVAFDKDGAGAVAVWTVLENNGQLKRRLVAARKGAAVGAWGPAQTIMSSTGTIGGPQAVILPNNDIVVTVWEQPSSGNGRPALYRYRQQTGQWLAGNASPTGPGSADSPYLPDFPAGDGKPPRLVANASGQLRLVWTHKYSGWASGECILMSRLEPSTNTWSPIVRVDAAAPGETARAPDATVDKRGNTLIVWAQSSGTGVDARQDLYAARFNAGSNQFELQPTRVNRHLLGVANYKTSLSGNADGHAIVSWNQYASANASTTSVFVSRFDADALKFGQPKIVEADETRNAENSDQSVALARDGSAIAVWGNGNAMFNRGLGAGQASQQLAARSR
jgi:hypothetical protein